jgi:hypothetical protein
MITVGKLIEILKDFDPDSIVICQKDAEGNGYSPLAVAYDNVSYLAANTWDGIVLDIDTDEAVPCVVLKPTN